ncbi:MAG: hypothetical protein WBC00_01590, partial [Candidatus Omnitrophota bacterium]
MGVNKYMSFPGMRYTRWFKIIAMVVVCLFTLNSITFANPDILGKQNSTSCLQPQTSIAPFVSDRLFHEMMLKFYTKGIIDSIQKHEDFNLRLTLPICQGEQSLVLDFGNKKIDPEKNEYTIPCSVIDKDENTLRKYSAIADLTDRSVSLEEITAAEPKTKEVITAEEGKPVPTAHTYSWRYPRGMSVKAAGFTKEEAGYFKIIAGLIFDDARILESLRNSGRFKGYDMKGVKEVVLYSPEDETARHLMGKVEISRTYDALLIPVTDPQNVYTEISKALWQVIRPEPLDYEIEEWDEWGKTLLERHDPKMLERIRRCIGWDWKNMDPDHLFAKRSMWLKLEKPIKIGNLTFRYVKIKGVTYNGVIPPSSERYYEGQGRSLGVDENGSFEQVIRTNILGAMNRGSAEREFNIMGADHIDEVSAVCRIARGVYPDLELDGQKGGFVAMLVPEYPEMALDQLVVDALPGLKAEAKRLKREGSSAKALSGNALDFFEKAKSFIVDHGRQVRRGNDRGFFYQSPHHNNCILIDTGLGIEPRMKDFDSTEVIDRDSDHERMVACRLVDLIQVFKHYDNLPGVNSTLKTVFERIGFDPVRLFLEGYFFDHKGDPAIESFYSAPERQKIYATVGEGPVAESCHPAIELLKKVEYKEPSLEEKVEEIIKNEPDLGKHREFLLLLGRREYLGVKRLDELVRLDLKKFKFALASIAYLGVEKFEELAREDLFGKQVLAESLYDRPVRFGEAMKHIETLGIERLKSLFEDDLAGGENLRWNFRHDPYSFGMAVSFMLSHFGVRGFRMFWEDLSNDEFIGPESLREAIRKDFGLFTCSLGFIIDIGVDNFKIIEEFIGKETLKGILSSDPKSFYDLLNQINLIGVIKFFVIYNILMREEYLGPDTIKKAFLNDPLSFTEGMVRINRAGIDGFIASLTSDRIEKLKRLIDEGIASDLTLPYREDFLPYEVSLIRNRAFSVERIEYLKTLAELLPENNRRKRSLYLASGADVSTALMVSGQAEETILADKLLFYPAKQVSEEMREYCRWLYFNDKYHRNFANARVVKAEIGAGQYLLWELEAMGVEPESIKIEYDETPGAHRISFTLPGEKSEKSIVYFEVRDVTNIKNYSDPQLDHILFGGIDTYVQKACMEMRLSGEVTSLITGSLDKDGVFFVDKGSVQRDGYEGKARDVLPQYGLVPVDEERMAEVRQIEADYNLSFGYSRAEVYKKRTDESLPEKKPEDGQPETKGLTGRTILGVLLAGILTPRLVLAAEVGLQLGQGAGASWLAAPLIIAGIVVFSFLGMMGLGGRLQLNLEMAEQLETKLKMKLKQLMGLTIRIEKEDPVPPEAKVGLEGLREADRILKEHGAVGIVIGSTGIDLYNGRKKDEDLEKHSDIDVVVLTAASQLKKPFEKFEGGIDWWFPEELPGNMNIKDAHGARVKRIFVNGNGVFMKAGVEVDTKLARVKLPGSGLYLPARDFAVDLTECTAMALVDPEIEVDLATKDRFRRKVDRDVIRKTMSPVWRDNFGGKVLHKALLETVEFDLKTVAAINDSTPYVEIKGRKKPPKAGKPAPQVTIPPPSEEIKAETFKWDVWYFLKDIFTSEWVETILASAESYVITGKEKGQGFISSTYFKNKAGMTLRFVKYPNHGIVGIVEDKGEAVDHITVHNHIAGNLNAGVAKGRTLGWVDIKRWQLGEEWIKPREDGTSYVVGKLDKSGRESRTGHYIGRKSAKKGEDAFVLGTLVDVPDFGVILVWHKYDPKTGGIFGKPLRVFTARKKEVVNAVFRKTVPEELDITKEALGKPRILDVIYQALRKVPAVKYFSKNKEYAVSASNEGEVYITDLSERGYEKISELRSGLESLLDKYGYGKEAKIAFDSFFHETTVNAVKAKGFMRFTREHGSLESFVARKDMNLEEKYKIVRQYLEESFKVTGLRIFWEINGQNVKLGVSNDSLPDQYHLSRIEESYVSSPGDIADLAEAGHFAGDAKATTAFSSTGRGIAIARSQINDAGGDLTFSFENGWTTFSMHIPGPEQSGVLHGSPGLIGKWHPLEGVNFSYDEKLKKHVSVFWAINIETNEAKRIVLFARRAPPGTFEKFKRTGIPEVDKELEEVLGLVPQSNKLLKPIPEENRLILESNPYGINGLAVARYEGGLVKPYLAVVEPLKDDPIALTHELLHAADTIITPHIQGGEEALKEYISREGKKHRLLEEMRDHYAYRLFAKQRFGDEDIETSRMIREIKVASSGYEEYIHPAYQNTLDLDIETVPGGAADMKFDHANSVGVGADSPRDKIEDEVRKQVIRRSWWLSGYWVKKGLPKEQLVISAGADQREGGWQVTVYNWRDQVLSSEQISVMKRVLEDFTHIAGGEALKRCPYILIEDHQEANIK